VLFTALALIIAEASLAFFMEAAAAAAAAPLPVVVLVMGLTSARACCSLVL
jgi:hypothetical protein